MVDAESMVRRAHHERTLQLRGWVDSALRRL